MYRKKLQISKRPRCQKLSIAESSVLSLGEGISGKGEVGQDAPNIAGDVLLDLPKKQFSCRMGDFCWKICLLKNARIGSPVNQKIHASDIGCL